jgi:uncharacterized protein YbcV (DUF1398 family)
MDTTIIDVIERCAAASHAGTTDFASILRSLVEVGVSGYFADYRARSTTYYGPGDATHAVALHTPDPPIGDCFDAAVVEESVRASQRGEMKYPAFVDTTRRAGCVGYQVWIAGRHVVYLGRRGETHVERFP